MFFEVATTVLSILLLCMLVLLGIAISVAWKLLSQEDKLKLKIRRLEEAVEDLTAKLEHSKSKLGMTQKVLFDFTLTPTENQKTPQEKLKEKAETVTNANRVNPLRNSKSFNFSANHRSVAKHVKRHQRQKSLQSFGTITNEIASEDDYHKGRYPDTDNEDVDLFVSDISKKTGKTSSNQKSEGQQPEQKAQGEKPRQDKKETGIETKETLLVLSENRDNKEEKETEKEVKKEPNENAIESKKERENEFTFNEKEREEQEYSYDKYIQSAPISPHSSFSSPSTSPSPTKAVLTRSSSSTRVDVINNNSDNSLMDVDTDEELIPRKRVTVLQRKDQQSRKKILSAPDWLSQRSNNGVIIG